MPHHYQNPEGDPELGDESARDLEILSNHICRWWGNIPEVFHETVPYCGGILSIPSLCPKEAWSVHVRDGKEVFFFALLPLYDAELRFAWERGSDALFEALDRIELTELIDTGRRCAV